MNSQQIKSDKNKSNDKNKVKGTIKNLKIIYCLLISSQFSEDHEEFNRNDDFYINMLTNHDFKIDIADDPRLIKWYTDKGFEIEEHWLGGNKYIHLNWHNYRKICDC